VTLSWSIYTQDYEHSAASCLSLNQLAPETYLLHERGITGRGPRAKEDMLPGSYRSCVCSTRSKIVVGHVGQNELSFQLLASERQVTIEQSCSTLLSAFLQVPASDISFDKCAIHAMLLERWYGCNNPMSQAVLLPSSPPSVSSRQSQPYLARNS